jgi:hypothetical protein
MRILVATFVLMFVSLAMAENYGFLIPSYASVRGGITEIDSYFLSLNTGLTLSNNRILGVSLETIEMPNTVEQGTLDLQSGSVSLSTDPLKDWSFQGAVDAWLSEDTVSAYGFRFGTTWSGKRWMWTLEYSLQQISFAELPVLLWSDRKSTVSENSVLLATNVQIFRNFSLNVSHRRHWYNTPMEEYAEGIRSRFIAAEVLNIAGTLTKESTEFGVTYWRRRWSLGVEASSAVSSLDELRTNGLGLRIGYRLRKAWSIEVQGARYESENLAENSNPLHSLSSSATYTW